MSSKEIQELEQRWAMPTYKRTPIAFVRGEGPRLWDAEGNEYLDFFTGISVSSIGHCHPKVVEAIREQAGTYIHASNLFGSDKRALLAERLCRSSLGGKAFLCNSGAEAVEVAIKLVRKHAHGRGTAEPEIVVLEDAFHGRTMGAVSATPGMAANESFAPYLPGFRVVPRDDPEALSKAVGERTAAVLLEPIQGEAGIHPVPDEVIAAAREACERSGAILAFDEIQTGMGRTGSLWAYEQLPVRPDLMTSAKALGGGLPVGACISDEELGDVLEPGDHGSTFAGSPVVAAAALAAFDVIDDPELLRRVRELGSRLCDGLERLDGVDEVRGRGLMVGVGLGDGLDATEIQQRLLSDGLVVNVPAERTLRLLPPLVIGEAEVDEALEKIGRALG